MIPLADKSVNCCVTSPPYWGLRDYGVAGQLGLERTPEEYIAAMLEVFREVKRVLRDDGTLWLNMGDSYANNGLKDASKVGGFTRDTIRRHAAGESLKPKQSSMPREIPPGLKPKDLVGIPWMLAFALRADGWYLRSDIIWAKPNPMPESVTDRPTKAHEYIFLLSKSERYYYDAEAIREANVAGDNGSSFVSSQDVLTKENLGTGKRKISRPAGWATGKDHTAIGWANSNGQGRGQATEYAESEFSEKRNKRSVWTVGTQAFPEAHFATFPEELIKPCILAGCPAGGTVLDPFAGSGTTVLVARELQCKGVGLELNPAYIEIAKRRLAQEVLSFG